MEKPTIIAAGGLVLNKKRELLMIFRRNFWDLPKGKLDPGESIAACAVREVQEETGLKDLILGELIGLTYHQYFDKWQHQEVIKETHWFAMKILGEQSLTPQLEEDITQVVWANKEQVAEFMEQSYPNIIQIIKKYNFY